MFVDSYFMKWKLQDAEGFEWWEEYPGISLSDFEVIYELNQHHIIECYLNLLKEEVVS